MRATLLLGLLLPTVASGETCRFAGTTSHDGRLAAAVTATEAADGPLTVDVTVSFAISVLGRDVRYYGQEISVWQDGVLTQVGVNQRTLIDGDIKRQQWDVFRRRGGALEAFRVQAKRLVDFAPHYPGFVAHWAPARFGEPWLADYAAAPPDRRPDLDLPGPADARVPLAEAFYWSRFQGPDGGTARLVLPGFKRDKETLLRFGAAVAGPDWARWAAPLVHPGLERRPESVAAAWVSSSHYLVQLGFEVHTEWAGGQAVLRPLGCTGVQVRPP